MRYHRKFLASQAAERNRLLRRLETANIRLASVARDVFGVSGRAMLKAMIEGNASVEEMAGLAKGQLRRKHDDWCSSSRARSRNTIAFCWQCSCVGLKPLRTTLRHSTCASQSGSNPIASSTLC